MPFMQKITPKARRHSAKHSWPRQKDRTENGPLVVAIVYDGLCTFEFAIAAEIFGLDRPEMGPGWYRFSAAAIEPGPLRAQGGLHVAADAGLELLDRADIIIVPGWKGVNVDVPPGVIERLKSAQKRGARLVSICSGAFVLAATGLLDGRRAATHWRYAGLLSQKHPAISVDSSVLYIDEGELLTSAGSAAGIDLMLHIIRQDFGSNAANSVARRLVVPAHRDGGQAQFIERAVPRHEREALGPLLERVRKDLSISWTITTLAKYARMSERTFLRRFKDATGASPGDWLTQVRIEEARRLLEETTLSIEEVADAAGFGSVANLRHHFAQRMLTTPTDYRGRFATGTAGNGNHKFE